MRIPLNRDGESPLYRQIEEYLRGRILSGALAPQTRLPASRDLARDLGVSRITVENAYAELEADGLIASKMGSGTFVLAPDPSPLPRSGGRPLPRPLWQQSLPTGDTPSMTPDAMLAKAGHPRPISFAGGTGDPRVFPAEDFRKTMQAVMRRDGAGALEYGEARGYGPLRGTIARILASQGLAVQPENVLITSGSQQAISLVARFLLQPGDVVLTESPTYGWGLELFRALGLRVAGIPVDDEGMQVGRLEEMLQQHHPKLIYTIPNFQNPTGACLSGSRRRRLIDLAGRYNVPVLEDDFVGDLRYEGRAQPALKSLDPDGRVIYVSTFSKMLLPGLRVGFLAADGPIFERLVEFKRLHDLSTSDLIQRAVDEYVTVGRYGAHLRRSRRVYSRRRDAMLQAIRRYFPSEVHVDPPKGGLFVWLRLPRGLSAEEILVLACRNGVAFAPGPGFFPDPSEGREFVRLNFAAVPVENIEEGIKRLGRALQL